MFKAAKRKAPEPQGRIEDRYVAHGVPEGAQELRPSLWEITSLATAQCPGSE